MHRNSPRSIGASTALLAALCLASGAPAGERPEPLGEVQPGSDPLFDRQSGGFVALGDDIVFFARDPQHGLEPRLYDGIEVSLLEDVRPGGGSGMVSAPIELGDRFYFAGDDGVLGAELWVSDGGPGGTLPVVDICPGSCRGVKSPPVVAGGKLWFAGDDGASGTELWSSDGTAAGTRRVADVCTGSCSSVPAELTEWNGRVYFVAAGPGGGEELWVSDGTAAGTVQVTDLCPGLCGSAPALLTPWAGHLYFAARPPKAGFDVWRVGPAGQVERVTDLGLGTVSLRRLFPFANRLWIVASSGSLPYWRTDGTVGGTWPATELTGMSGLFPLGDQLFLTAGSSGASYELWVLDASAGLPRPITAGFSVRPQSFARFGERAVFTAATPETGTEPWVTDGTTAGTYLLADAAPGPSGSGPSGFTQVGDRLAFAAASEPWISDGTFAGTHQLAQFAAPQPRGFVGPIAALGDLAYFMPIQPPPMLLWRSDGTAPGTEPVLSWGPLSGLSLGTIDGRLYLTGWLDDTYGLYVTDGTAAGTVRLAEEGSQVTSALGSVYFSTVSHGQQLWVTDGTVDGTHFIVDVNPGYSTVCPIMCPLIPDYPRLLTDARELLFFVAFEPGSRLQIWVSDGTAAGTRPLRTFPDEDPGPAEMAGHAGGVLFPSHLGGGGIELWWSDGTPEGTVPVADLAPGPRSSRPRGFVRLGETTLFVASDPGGGDQLYRADGAPPVVSRVRTLSTEGVRAQAGGLFVAGAEAYFPLYHPATGRELWVTDGTQAGTGPLVDLRPGPGGSYPRPLAFTAGRLFFAADDGASGLELWATDGTDEGTALVHDLAPGAAPSAPNSAALAGDLLVFFADDGVRGNEPWAFDPSSLEPPAPRKPQARDPGR